MRLTYDCCFRETVRDIVEAIQPERAKLLKAQRLHRRVYNVKGPNHIWHIDGNDKLKPFGFCISGCMDGFSRKLIWLEVARTNKNPDLVCTNFLNAIADLRVVPSIVRMDRGTENVHIANAQQLLRSNHTDSLASVAVMYGSSTHNQRIERFWLYLRQTVLGQYMSLFKDYVEASVIDTSNRIHMECLAFCFMDVIRSDVNGILLSWNNHQVRKMKHCVCPSGIPNVLYEEPALFNFAHQGKAVDYQILNGCKEIHAFGCQDCDPDFEEWALEKMLAAGKVSPQNMHDAMSLFSYLIVEVWNESL